MGYVTEKKSQIHSELDLISPRLKSFATALTGTSALSETLVKATKSYVLARAAKQRGHTPLLLWAYRQMHMIWAARMKSPYEDERKQPADPWLFLPRSRADDAGAVRIARLISQFPPLHRATLHLSYGERLSYDEVAEIFDIPVATVMTRLVKCHAALYPGDGRQKEANNDHVPSQHHAAELTAQDAGWAA